MAENTLPSWQACTGDEIAVIMRGKGKVALTDMRAAWATEGSLAGKLVDRALRLTDHGWVHEKLPHIAGLVAALLVGPGTDMFLNCGPGWGKTVLMRIATFGASGVCTVNMPLKALAQQVFDSLQSMAAAASKREGRVVARVYYVTCSMANGTTEPDAASFDELRRYAQAARRSTTPVTILVHGPEVTGTKGWKDMCLAVSGNGAFTICCEDEVHPHVVSLSLSLSLSLSAHHAVHADTCHAVCPFRRTHYHSMQWHTCHACRITDRIM